jgi:ribose/xylose/arabinose/galactoside ABC-type transport system permease subunit
VGLAGSSLLAGLGGVALTIEVQTADPTAGGTDLTIMALAVVLIGGVSIFGRRGGVLGVVFGALIVEAIFFITQAHSVSPVWAEALVGVLILLGLGLSRGLETIANSLDRQQGSVRL